MTEQILIGIFANIFGIGLGMIFLKLFFMVFSMLLRLPKELPVIFDMRAIGVTFVTYMLVFCYVIFYKCFTYMEYKNHRLLKEFRTDKTREENIKVALFIRLCLFRNGICASATSDDANDSIILFPVSILIFFGTYFSFTHGC